jgi:hypothetical protein
MVAQLFTNFLACNRYVTIYELLRLYTNDQPVYIRDLIAGGISSFVAQVFMIIPCIRVKWLIKNAKINQDNLVVWE